MKFLIILLAVVGLAYCKWPQPILPRSDFDEYSTSLGDTRVSWYNRLKGPYGHSLLGGGSLGNAGLGVYDKGYPYGKPYGLKMMEE